MEAILRRLERIKESHKNYSEVMKLQLSTLSEEISNLTPTQQGSQENTNENSNSNATTSRGAPSRTVIVNNNPRAGTSSSRGAVTNGRVTNVFSRPNNENGAPRTRRMIQLLNRAGLPNRPARINCTTSKKMRDFSLEPINGKTVDKIPGIGPKATEKLSRLNYVYALRLLGKFLEDEKEEFVEFLKREAQVLPHNAEKAWRSLDDYRTNIM